MCMLTWRVFAEPVTKMHACILAIVIRMYSYMLSTI